MFHSSIFNCSIRNAEVMQFLPEKVADINMKVKGFAPLHLAVMNKECIRILLEADSSKDRLDPICIVAFIRTNPKQ